jgi:hypothetical protein
MRWFLAFGLLLGLLIPSWALRLEPLPLVSAWPASGPALDHRGLVDLALALSGVPDASLGAYGAVLDRWAADFNTGVDPGWDEARKAEALLQFLHTRMTGGYSIYQTRLDVLVDRGTFNCVSSALAYMIVGRQVGLDIQAVATPDHAFALVRLGDGRQIDVETTTPYGFEPGKKTEFKNAFGQTGFVYVPPGNYAQRKTIGDRQLLGLLVQNRMADFERAGQPEEAVGPAIDRWTFEGTPEAKKTLIDGFVNDASWLNSRREYLRGLDLVDKMVAWTGPVDEAKQLAWAFLNNHVNTLLDKQDFAGAQALTVAWKNRGFLTNAQAAQTQGVIADRQLAVAVKTQPYVQAAAQVDQAFGQGTVTAARRQELLTYLYGQEVQRVAGAQGPQAAWAFLGTLPAEVQAFASLAKARSVYAYTWSVEVHNRFAQLWNDGKKAEARKVLQDTLAVLTDSALLKKDLVLSQGSP